MWSLMVALLSWHREVSETGPKGGVFYCMASSRPPPAPGPQLRAGASWSSRTGGHESPGKLLCLGPQLGDGNMGGGLMSLLRTLLWLGWGFPHLPGTSPGFPGFGVGIEWFLVGSQILNLC